MAFSLLIKNKRKLNMIQGVIYYFSGTGNSYVTAKKIAQKTKFKLVNIAKVATGQTHPIQSETVGLVFPIYYLELPQIVEEFINELYATKDTYIYAVATYGGGKGGSLKSINKILDAKELRLSAFYGVQMPQNAFKKPFDNYEKCYVKSKKITDKIIKNINDRKNGIFYTNRFTNILQAILYPALKSLVKKELPKKLDSEPQKTLKATILNLDKLIKVSDACNHCGICITVCPVKNIDLTERSPVWKHHCQNCLSCYNFCTQKAIEFDVVSNNHRYIHPEYTIDDAIDNNF